MLGRVENLHPKESFTCIVTGLSPTLCENRTKMNVIDRFCHIYSDITQFSPDDLATIYGRDVVFIDPITTHKGIDDVKRYFENLLGQAQSCKFDISAILPTTDNDSGVTHCVSWTMHLTLKTGNKYINVDGITQLKVVDDIIVYHKDYYDLGEMVYEHIPLLGYFVKKIKTRLAK